MKSSLTTGTPVWITVRVSRGFVTDARVFANENDAARLHYQWRYHERFNPDYDEVEVVASRVESCLPEVFRANEVAKEEVPQDSDEDGDVG